MTGSTSGVRGRRTGWASGRSLVLTERDLQLFFFLGVCGIARTRDVVRLFFGARGTANDRLRKLFVAGFLQCFVRDLAGDNLYALTDRGLQVLVERKGIDPTTLRIVRKLPSKLEHTLEILAVRLHLSLACRTHPRYALAAFDTDADLAAERHAALLDLVPDARVALVDRASGGRVMFFLEVDRGTENTTWLVRHKLRRYADAAATHTPLYGIVDPLIVFVVPSERRARSLAERIVAERVSARVVLALTPNLSDANVLGVAYARPEDVALPSRAGDVRGAFCLSLLP